MESSPHASTECRGCDWERQPQAFRWFPEIGEPLRIVRGEPTDEGPRLFRDAPSFM